MNKSTVIGAGEKPFHAEGTVYLKHVGFFLLFFPSSFSYIHHTPVLSFFSFFFFKVILTLLCPFLQEGFGYLPFYFAGTSLFGGEEPSVISRVDPDLINYFKHLEKKDVWSLLPQHIPIKNARNMLSEQSLGGLKCLLPI